MNDPSLELASTREELPRVLRRAMGFVRYARDYVGAQSASLFLVDDDGTSMQGLLSDWDWTRTSFTTRLSDWPTVEQSLSEGDVRVITVAEAAGTETGWFEARGVRTSICVPLRADVASAGVLFFDFEGGACDERAIGMLGDVGRRCARALARATERGGSRTTWLH